jgi:multiple sugar transport system substrate-binding protein
MAFDTVHGKDGQPLAYASGSAWAIPKGSANPQAACRFAKVMTATDSWMKAAAARVEARKADGAVFTGLLTGNKTADDQIRETYVTSSGDAKWDAGVEAFYTANDHTFSLPANPADTEFKTAWQDAVNRVLNGQQEPQAALSQAQQEAQSALDKAWASWDSQPK